MRALLTIADLDERDPNGCSISARHEAVLSNGRRVVWLDDRGWTSSRLDTSVEEVERTARMVIAPDEPAPGETCLQKETDHWAALRRKLRELGISTNGVELRSLPHEIELSDRLRVLLKT